jgi:hypothetical protein
MGYNYFNDDTKNRPQIQQGRTSVRIVYGEDRKIVADLYSRYGIVNICLSDILNDVYMAYSTSELALEYQNGNPKVRGKDAIRYVKLATPTATGAMAGKATAEPIAAKVPTIQAKPAAT